MCYIRNLDYYGPLGYFHLKKLLFYIILHLYYNHSYRFFGNAKFIISKCSFQNELIPSIIKSKKIIGIQFHPEKSQSSGKKLLVNIIKKLVNG